MRVTDIHCSVDITRLECGKKKLKHLQREAVRLEALESLQDLSLWIVFRYSLVIKSSSKNLQILFRILEKIIFLDQYCKTARPIEPIIKV